jgi:hypothetical protein
MVTTATRTITTAIKIPTETNETRTISMKEEINQE